MKRGLTLPELLAALALMASLTSMTASLMMTANRILAETEPGLRWECAAAATMQRISEDLLVGDLSVPGVSRVALTDGSLTIWTRDCAAGRPHGRVLARYHHDRSQATLRRTTRSPDGSTSTRRLLDHVAAWSCVIDAEAGSLVVSISSSGDNGVTGRLRLP